MQLKSILEYRKTFIISCFGQTATSIFSLLAIMFLFNKFGNVNGYTFDEVLICFAISFLGFSIAECFFRAFDQFDKMISNLSASYLPQRNKVYLQQHCSQDSLEYH